MRYKGKYVLRITSEHVGRAWASLGKCACCGASKGMISFVDVMGYPQPQDVGKLVFDVGGRVYQVENDEQRDRRVAQGG